MKNFKLLAILTFCFVTTACSTTGGHKMQPVQKFAVTGTVVESIKSPEVCKEKTSSARTIGGAIAGGLIGNQMGKGNGKKAMTVIGTILGASAGKKSNDKYKGKYRCRSNTWDTTLAFMNPVTKQMDFQMMITDRKKRKGTRINVTYVLPIKQPQIQTN